MSSRSGVLDDEGIAYLIEEKKKIRGEVKFYKENITTFYKKEDRDSKIGLKLNITRLKEYIESELEIHKNGLKEAEKELVKAKEASAKEEIKFIKNEITDFNSIIDYLNIEKKEHEYIYGSESASKSRTKRGGSIIKRLLVKPVKPKAKPVKPKAKPVKPKAKPVKPKAKPVKSKVKPVKPKAKPVKPKVKPVKPKVKPVKPKVKPVKPKAKPVKAK